MLGTLHLLSSSANAVKLASAIAQDKTRPMVKLNMHSPPHPGLSLRDSVLPALGLSVTQAAMQLGVSRAAFSRVINGHAAISPDMALRIEAWLGKWRGGDAHVWLAMQSAYDLWQAKKRLKGLLKSVKAAPVYMDVAWDRMPAVGKEIQL
jgi:antitoxin HigA-1